MAQMSVKVRKEHNSNNKFNEMRADIRTAAHAARLAYTEAAQAQPATPKVAEFLQVMFSGR